MNKIGIIMAILMCLIIVMIFAFNYTDYNKKIIEEKEEEKRQLQLAVEEHQKKYRTLDEIREKYQMLEMDMTTEMIIKKNPKKEYLDNLIGKNIFLYIQIYDIKSINGKRIIFAEDERTGSRRADVTGLDFVIYDDNEKVNNVLVNDKIDIEVIIDKVSIAENTLGVSKSPISKATLYFSVINMEKDWGNFDRRSNSHRDQRL